MSSTTATIGTANITTIPSTTITSLIAPSLSSTTGTIANLTSTNASLTTANITNLSASNETVSGTSNLTTVNISGNMSGANAYLQNTATQNLAAQGAQFGFNGLLVVGDTTLIGALQATGGLSAPSANITTETVGTSSITSLTASSLSSTTGTITNLSSTTATIGTANITTIPSTTITSLTAPSLSSTTGTITNLTSTNLRATTATVSGTTYLNDTISSGNMSGANGYFLNLAGENLACQSANVGFSGLSVVGTSSLIGALYATGGINSQGITTTTLTSGNILPLTSDTYTLGSTGALWKGIYVGTGSVHIGNVTLSAPDNQSLVIDKPVSLTSLAVSYSSSTGSAGAVTSNTTRGNIMIPNGSTGATVTNSLVNTDTFVYATVSAPSNGNFVNYIVNSNGSFTIYLPGAAVGDIYVRWMIVN